MQARTFYTQGDKNIWLDLVFFSPEVIRLAVSDLADA